MKRWKLAASGSANTLDVVRLPRFLRPNTRPELRPDPDDPAQHDAVVYIRSILWMRVGVGLAGVLLPWVLLLVDRYWFHGYPT